MDTDLLKKIGLTDGEIKVYIALFKLGSTSTGPLIKEAKIHSSKVYPILDRLIDKGLVSFIKEGKKTIYTANPATTILSYLDKLHSNINEQKSSAKKLIKELELLKTFEKTPSDATVFRGIKGVKSAYELAVKDLKKGDTVYSMFIPPVADNLLPFFIDFDKKIDEKYKANHRILFREKCREIDSIKHLKLIKIKIGVPQENKTPGEICVYGNNTLISNTSGSEYISILIRNKLIADSFKQQFNNLWKQQVYTFTGLEGVKSVFNDTLNYKEIFFIGGNWGIYKYFKDFFKNWNKEREKRKIKWHDLIDINLLLEKKHNPHLKYYDFKVEPEQVSSPAVILFYGIKVVTILWDKKNTILNVVESKPIFDHYKKYFNFLWNQEVKVSYGFKALQNAHEKTYNELKPGEEYIYLGIPKFQPEKHHNYWKKDHERREKSGIKCRLLFNKDTNPEILINRNSYKGCDARYMESDIKTPSNICVFHNNVNIIIQKEIPITIQIKNQAIAESFRAYFESFWTKSKKII